MTSQWRNFEIFFIILIGWNQFFNKLWNWCYGERDIYKKFEWFTFKSSSVNGAQYGSTEAQNLFGVSFLAVDVFTCSTGSSSIGSSSAAGFCDTI